ncbi:MAG: hypothetical protein GXP36_14605 [Actinobacteria bacterium]|nr:hypothetical protein [Actinomycetota bacterium]
MPYRCSPEFRRRAVELARDLLSRAAAFFASENVLRKWFPWFMDANKADFPIRFMASRLGVSTPGFYGW